MPRSRSHSCASPRSRAVEALPIPYVDDVLIAEIGEEAFARLREHAAAAIQGHPLAGNPWTLYEAMLSELARGWAATTNAGEVDA